MLGCTDFSHHPKPLPQKQYKLLLILTYLLFFNKKKRNVRAKELSNSQKVLINHLLEYFKLL